jgi:hypothetical protein
MIVFSCCDLFILRGAGFAEQSRLYLAVATCIDFVERGANPRYRINEKFMRDGISSCCAKSPDFVPVSIRCANFSKLYFRLFVDYWIGYEVRRLRRAVTIVFCCCDLYRLRRAVLRTRFYSLR